MSIAAQIASQLCRSIQQNGRASLVVCGGSSPVSLFQTFAKGAYEPPVDWACVTITLVDDRDLPADHQHSNQKLVRETLLQGPVSAAKFLPLCTSGAASKIDRPFDVMLLGMGVDGHFASLFPDMVGGPELCPDAPPAIIETGPNGSPKVPRVSMNLAMILQSRLILLLVTGAEKQAVLKSAETDSTLPVHALLTQTIMTIQIVKS